MKKNYVGNNRARKQHELLEYVGVAVISFTCVAVAVVSFDSVSVSFFVKEVFSCASWYASSGSVSIALSVSDAASCVSADVF